VGKDAEQMEAGRMAWIDGKHLAAEQPGFGKPAAGVAAERRMEQLSGRAARAGRRMRVDVAALLGDCAALSSVHLLAAAGLNMEKT
jgi:hypothetical protein